MKKCLHSILFVFLACGFSLAEEMPVFDAMITVHVIDDLGQPVSNATVAVSTFKKWHPGEGFGRDENEVITGISDTNGMVTLEIPCISGKVAYGTRDVEGYYKTYSKKFAYSHSDDVRWYPWNPTTELVLKRKIKPIPMYAKEVVLSQSDDIPITKQQVGYDLVKGDWVAPFGKGITSDFIIRINRELGGITESKHQLHDSSLTIEFSNKGDGILSEYVAPFSGSKLRLPHMAPEGKYSPRLIRSAYYHPKESFSERREDQNYFFRIRTEKDADGNIVRALYGKIYGPFTWRWDGIFRFTYYLNPTPNDRNLEFDPAQNLFTDLTSRERVKDP